MPLAVNVVAAESVASATGSSPGLDTEAGRLAGQLRTAAAVVYISRCAVASCFQAVSSKEPPAVSEDVEMDVALMCLKVRAWRLGLAVSRPGLDGRSRMCVCSQDMVAGGTQTDGCPTAAAVAFGAQDESYALFHELKRQAREAPRFEAQVAALSQAVVDLEAQVRRAHAHAPI